MEFHNPNVATEMAQILKDYQLNYVPCFENSTGKKTVLANIPVHGDQLFEERVRNVEWAFQDGEDKNMQTGMLRLHYTRYTRLPKTT